MTEDFDLYDGEGRTLGISKPRDLVHRDGDWHRSIALWIVRADGRLVFQRRGMGKDTWPGKLTGSVTGHYAAGETLAEVLREAREEIGLAVRLDELIPLGAWRSDDEPAPGVIDRELQDVFLWPLDWPLRDLRPDPGEVSEVLEVAPLDLLRLLDGRTAAIEAPFVAAEHGRAGIRRVALADFVPANAYHAWVARAALAHAAGR